VFPLFEYFLNKNFEQHNPLTKYVPKQDELQNH